MAGFYAVDAQDIPEKDCYANPTAGTLNRQASLSGAILSGALPSQGLKHGLVLLPPSVPLLHRHTATSNVPLAVGGASGTGETSASVVHQRSTTGTCNNSNRAYSPPSGFAGANSGADEGTVVLCLGVSTVQLLSPSSGRQAVESFRGWQSGRQREIDRARTIKHEMNNNVRRRVT